MALQDDIFDLEHYLKADIPDKKIARDAQRCLDRILKRLAEAEAAEEELGAIRRSVGTLRQTLKGIF